LSGHKNDDDDSDDDYENNDNSINNDYHDKNRIMIPTAH
jgi:hypothetical protein